MGELVITNKGKELITKLIEGTETINFTRIKTSVHDYSKDDLENLTELGDVKQESLVSSIEKTDNTVVEVIAMVNNDGLNQGYYIKTIGLYAKDSKDNEILYGVSIAGEYPDYMPAFGGKTVSSISYKLITKVDNAEQVNIEINPDAIPTITQINELKQVVIEAKDVIDKHIKVSILSDDGAHDLRYDKNEKKFKYHDNGKWYDVELEGTGGISVSGLTADTLKTGVTVVIKQGEKELKRIVGTFTSDATAVASDIILGKIAYVNGQKIIGSYRKTNKPIASINFRMDPDKKEIKMHIVSMDTTLIEDADRYISGSQGGTIKIYFKRNARIVWSDHNDRSTNFGWGIVSNSKEIFERGRGETTVSSSSYVYLEAPPSFSGYWIVSNTLLIMAEIV